MDDAKRNDLHLQQIDEFDESDMNNSRKHKVVHCGKISCTDGNITEKYAGCHLCLSQCSSPFRAQLNPLPQNPSCWERIKFAVMCPPHGKVGSFFFFLSLTLTWWGVLVAMTDTDALPGGHLFSLLVLFSSCWIGGYLIAFIKLPPLLGMLLVGCLLNNAPYIDIAKHIDPTWSTNARQIALTVILVRAGLGLDPKSLRRLSFVVVRLAFSPCLAETITDGIAAHFLLGMPWTWSFMLGFVIAAVSPAVVVPSMLSLQEKGYGVEKGIPTLVIAAASIDDVLAITGFGVLLGITFSRGGLVWNLFKGPLEAVTGVVYGVLAGVLLWYIPQKSSRNLVLFRSILLMGLAVMALFLATYLKWTGAGPLGCLSLAFVAALKWRTEEHPDDKLSLRPTIEEVVGVLWMIFQPLLFGLIGAAISIKDIDSSTIALGLSTLAIGLGVRMTVSFFAVFCTNLNFWERFFISVAWLPKATVQAAIGSIALDTALMRHNDDEIKLGNQILTISVLSILITAPLGSVAIGLLGRRKLKQHLISTELEVMENSSDKQKLHDTNKQNGEESEPLNNEDQHYLV